MNVDGEVLMGMAHRLKGGRVHRGVDMSRRDNLFGTTVESIGGPRFRLLGPEVPEGTVDSGTGPPVLVNIWEDPPSGGGRRGRGCEYSKELGQLKTRLGII